ncbi:hypothetical protein BsWGS_27670 [Bradybaena similaris]
MQISLVFAVLVFHICHRSYSQNVTVTCEEGKYPPDPRTKVGTFIINLDQPPEKRWTTLAKVMGPGIQQLLESFKQYAKDWTKAADAIIHFVDTKGGSLDGTLPYPFAGEISGFANDSGINLGELLLYNLFYEFFTVCTSIVAEDPNGTLYHARNLDFGLFLGWDIKNKTWAITEKLRPLIVNLDWQRGGQTVFKSTNFAGYIGILTAVKPKLFTLTMNERFNIDGGFIGGNSSGQGAVITRSREGAVDVWGMRNASGWYILETNYDHWKAPLIVDDRRGPAHKCMDKMGQKNVGFAGIFNVLSSQPVLNKLTTYTALMHVASGNLTTFIQTCKDPCSPW